MARRANIFIELSSTKWHPAVSCQKMNVYSGPLGRKTLGLLCFYKDVGPTGHGSQLELILNYI